MPMRRVTDRSPSSPELPRWLTRTGAPQLAITPLAIASPRSSLRLSALFRHAARTALASSLTLTAAGCGTAHELVGNNPAGTAGNAGGAAGSGSTAGSFAGGTSGVSGGWSGDLGTAGAPYYAGDAGTGVYNPVNPLQCNAEGRLDLSRITVQQPLDFVGWRIDYSGSSATELGRQGTPCASAQNYSTCLQSLDDISNHVVADDEDAGFGFSQQSFLVTTQGDAVFAALDPTTQRAILGNIDSPEEAALMAALSGYVADPYSLCAQGKAQAWVTDGGYTVQFEQDPYCSELRRITVFVSYDGVVNQFSDEYVGPATCAVGRRPEGLQCESAPDALRTLGGFFSDVAQLEAASVSAFRVIAAELVQLGAPAQLVAAAQRAADDEVMHAAITAQLSRRFGAEPKTPVVRDCALRGLEAFATDNAVEGCVRETYGAALATYQAQAAADDEVRAALALIARDETRHASLSWEIAAWVEPKLDAAARERVRSAQVDAVRTLAQELRAQPAAELQSQAGMPNVVAAHQLLATLNHALWGVA